MGSCDCVIIVCIIVAAIVLEEPKILCFLPLAML